MSKIDSYKHLNESCKLNIGLSIEYIAHECCNLNYGAHRLLSAIVHELRERNNKLMRELNEKYPGEYMVDPCELADGIEALLNKGLF